MPRLKNKLYTSQSYSVKRSSLAERETETKKNGAGDEINADNVSIILLYIYERKHTVKL